MSLSKSEITEKINGYIKCIEDSGKIYWNKGIVPDETDWGLTATKCGASCTSNTFSTGIQCNGFARFIAYLLTGTKLGNVYGENHNDDVGGGWIKKSNLDNYIFCPGDVVEVNDSRGEHSAVVISSDGINVQFLELWSSEGCQVAHGDFNGGATWTDSTVTGIKSFASHVIKCPSIEKVFVEPPELPPDGTTSTIDLYRNHTSTDAVLYKNDLEYTPGSADMISGGEVPTRTGYRFLGWYTARTGGTKVTKYSDIPEGTAALYAQWVETVTVSFYNDLASNGGKLIGTRTYEVGKKYSTVGFPSPGTRVGYTFDKWYTATGGYVETWSDVTKTRTALYAHWNANTYTVTLKNNDGTNISENHNIQFGGKYGDALAALDDRCGYSFVEWNTKADGTGTVYNENSNAEAKNITLHAIWEVKKVEVNYKYGYEVNGEEKTGSGEVDYGDTYGDVVGTNVPDMDNMVHPDGSYDFVGWYHDKVEENDTVVMDAEHTLTAKWEKKKYKVSFSAGNGEFMDPIPDMEVTHGDTYGVLPVPRSNDLRKFNYWYYDDGENNTAYGEESQVKEGDHTLTASWSSYMYVRFLYEDSNGNECSAGRSQIYGNLYRDVPELPEKEGYDAMWVFLGEDSPYNGTPFTPRMMVHPDHPDVICAVYALKP
ncbi:MAG: hypothetical protein E7578_07755 [Ruminococcaceae bacterium]|nr:hypothetical protein [Oscillospiraceae bacterium]